MNSTSKFLFTLLYFALSSNISGASTLTPDDLIKVDSNTESNCVEYYHYKDGLYCTTTAYSSEPVDPKLKQEEKLSIQFDDRPWQLAWGMIKPDSTTIEYIPMGDNINNWNELITSQFFSGLPDNVTPKKFAEFFIQQFKDSGFNPIVSYLLDTPDQVIVEVRIEQPQNQIQDELVMITQDDNGMYLLHYVIKKSDMGKENRDKWLGNLKNSSIMD